LMTAIARRRKPMEGLRKLPAVLRLNRAANLVRWMCHRRHICGGNIWIESRRIILLIAKRS